MRNWFALRVLGHSFLGLLAAPIIACDGVKVYDRHVRMLLVAGPIRGWALRARSRDSVAMDRLSAKNEFIEPCLAYMGIGCYRVMRRTRIRVREKEAIVLWLLLYHGDLTDQEIADCAGCSRTSLYRMPFYKHMRVLVREAGIALLPRNGSAHGYDPVAERDR